MADKRQLDLFETKKPPKDSDTFRMHLTRRQVRLLRDGKTSPRIREIARTILGEDS